MARRKERVHMRAICKRSIAIGLLTMMTTGTLAQENLKQKVDPRQLAQSKPVIVKDAKFVLVAQTNWKGPLSSDAFTSVAPIEMQLQITNQSKGELLFPTYKALSVRLFDMGGREVKSRVEGDVKVATRPVL